MGNLEFDKKLFNTKCTQPQVSKWPQWALVSHELRNFEN